MLETTLTTARITFEYLEAIREHGGRVVDCFDDGRKLYLRAILQLEDKVKPRDRMYGGVALRMVAPEITVAPYLLREVCTNGAVAAHSVAAWRVRYSDNPSEEVMFEELRRRLRAASEPSVFEAEIERIQAATHARSEARRAFAERQLVFADEMVRRGAGPRFLELITQAEVQLESSYRGHEGRPLDPEPAFARIPRLKREEIAGRFARSSDGSRFSLMNAVTSVARDTRAPELKWDLEVVGAAVGAGFADARSLGLPGRSVDRQIESRRNPALDESLESGRSKTSSERQSRLLSTTQ